MLPATSDSARERAGRASRRLAGLVLALGAAAAVAAMLIERAMLAFTELSFDVRVAGAGSALLASFLLAAPLEEAAKTAVVWPLYRMRRIDGPKLGLCYAVATAGGFAAALGLFRLFGAPFDWCWLRVLCKIPAHLFFHGRWGYALGARRGQSRRWFAARGWSRGHARPVTVTCWGRAPDFSSRSSAARLKALAQRRARRWTLSGTPWPGSILPEPPRLSLVTDALNPATSRSCSLGAGGVVNVGLCSCCDRPRWRWATVWVSPFCGRRERTDLGRTARAARRGVARFVSARRYLVARASSSWRARAGVRALALASIVAVLALVAPLGVLFALAVAPLAFGLACGWAWIGLER